MKSVVRITSIFVLSVLAASPVVAQERGKAPEPKARVEIVRTTKKPDREASNQGRQRDESGDKERSREDKDKSDERDPNF